MIHRRISGGNDRSAGHLSRILVGLLAAVICGCQSTQHSAPSTSSTSASTTAARTSKTPAAAVNIAPLPVRPVQKSQPTTPDKCPATHPNLPAAPADGLAACDVGRTTIYTLGPETTRLGLTHVDSPKAVTSNVYEVTLILTPLSATQWAAFTAANVHNHVAFIRDDLVLEAPIIEERVTSGRIALTTQTMQVAGLLAQLADRPA